jgi:hypothetical protein
MSRMIYDYTKNSLEKVSSDINLFIKELKKAIRSLLPHEIEHLKNWLQFFITQKPELKDCLYIIN